MKQDTALGLYYASGTGHQFMSSKVWGRCLAAFTSWSSRNTVANTEQFTTRSMSIPADRDFRNTVLDLNCQSSRLALYAYLMQRVFRTVFGSLNLVSISVLSYPELVRFILR